MIPALTTELAATHRADLLRAAEARRRATAAVPRRSPLRVRLADHAERIAVRLRRPLPAAGRSTATVCCA